MTFRTAIEMRLALESKAVSSRELIEHSFAQMDSTEQTIQAFIHMVDRDEVVRRADRVDKARAQKTPISPWAGIPIAVKDNIAVKGLRLTCGSRILSNYVTAYHATAVERALRSGLLIIGKTNMDEFGFGSSTENSAFHPTRNPVDPTRVPGGTSGGSAAAVAAGYVPWALGTDTGGSVRQPAGLCGIVGMRPTYGRVSRYGLVAHASSLDVIGPLASTTPDAEALLGIIMGPDPKDSTSLPGLIEFSEGTLSGLRVGIPEEYTDEACQPEILSNMYNTLDSLRSLGWATINISLPMTKYAIAIYYIVASVEAASNLARYDGVKYGYRAEDANSWEEMVVRSRTEGFGDEAKRRIMLGTFASSAGYEDQYYGRAVNARDLLKAEFESAFQDVDVLVTPISPTTAWPLGSKTSDPILMYLSDVYSVPPALAGLPSIVVPTGVDRAGLPTALQICARVGDDALVLQAARTIELALNQHLND